MRAGCGKKYSLTQREGAFLIKREQEQTEGNERQQRIELHGRNKQSFFTAATLGRTGSRTGVSSGSVAQFCRH